jgi:hypothetical protein
MDKELFRKTEGFILNLKILLESKTPVRSNENILINKNYLQCFNNQNLFFY